MKGLSQFMQHKIVISTMLLMGRKPIALKRFCNQLGDDATVIPLITNPL